MSPRDEDRDRQAANQAGNGDSSWSVRRHDSLDPIEKQTRHREGAAPGGEYLDPTRADPATQIRQPARRRHSFRRRRSRAVKNPDPTGGHGHTRLTDRRRTDETRGDRGRRSKVPDYLAGGVHPSRAVLRVAESWYTVGPALVLCLAGATSPDWGDWTIYLGALGAQFGFVASVAHLGVRLRMRVRPVANELVAIYSVDALLAPVGLLAAFAAATEPWASLVVLPLLGLIAIFPLEREARIESVLTLRDAYRGTAHRLGEVLATTHEYTGSHSRSVVVIARQVGVSLGVSELVLREIEFGALLHDVGKMAVPNEILNKPTALTDDEMRTVRRHTLEGERMLERIGGMLGEMGPSCATTTSASTAPATRTGSG